ncbi:MAG: hypothetical protein JNK54_10870, partial [Elusimicrobia bacterium]|nr:hypothetical protein [Elusimicrobiota bacterium]
MGAGNVVGIEYAQPDVYQRKYGTTAGTWPDLDRFGRVTKRLYYCQNWRHDVVALVTNGGLLKERARCFSYGVPFEIPLGDCDGDGDTDTADQTLGLGTWG